MITGVRHTGIVVKDIDSALDFWVNVLEFDVVSNQIETGKFIDNLLGLDVVTVQTIKLIAKDKTMIELLHFKSHSRDNLWDGTPYSKGLTHVALNTLDIGKVTKRLSNLGYLPFNVQEISPNGKFKVCYVQAFEGLLIELVETLTT